MLNVTMYFAPDRTQRMVFRQAGSDRAMFKDARTFPVFVFLSVVTTFSTTFECMQNRNTPPTDSSSIDLSRSAIFRDTITVIE